MGGVYAASDGIFYILLKQDAAASWVGTYLTAVADTIRYETQRWFGQDFTILVRRECLDTCDYVRGTVQAMLVARPDLGQQCQAILDALLAYEALFAVPGLDSADFATYWPLFQEDDRTRGPRPAAGYPECLRGYFQLTQDAHDIEVMASAWLELDLPIVESIVAEVTALPFFPAGWSGSLQDVWDAVSAQYSVDFDDALIARMVEVTDAFGAAYIVGHTAADPVRFAATPAYLVNLVTGGEDFAVDYLDPMSAYSQLYLTSAKNSSLLTMINILVHEASHGYNFVLSARNTALSPLLNVNTALEVPTTEGMAFWREFEYYSAAQQLLGRTDLDPTQVTYLQLYGATLAEQQAAVLCARLETYLWRLVRYVRALCDVRVNGRHQTYTDFIAWASTATGLSEEFLHGECFTFMASPGYAPCYALGAATYAAAQAQAKKRGVTELEFNTAASSMGFYAWPVAELRLNSLCETARATP
ncbi:MULTISPECIES: hypothetical protein [Nocardioides]|uniref:Peptidase M3A/M3B catalytic domain-containing protein n=1 Tax=Nocardioides vastitatis TaxID=2568655 RepID=A0ABW0ZQP5_9ACTN|nr:hypothetical protein [Nocardioides sp.]